MAAAAAPPGFRARASPKNLETHIEALCRWERVSGREGERRAAEHIASVLRAEGIPHEVHEFSAYVSYPVAASLDVTPAPPAPLHIITHSFSAAVRGLRALLLLAKGPPEEIARMDLTGRIAVTEGMALPWTVRAVQRAGAAGHLNLCDNPKPHEMCLSPVWGSPTAEGMNELPTIPVVSTDHAGSAAIRQLLEAGRVEATLTTQVWTGWAPLMLPVATIRGPRSSNHIVLVGTHYDSWYVGATDTATSDALLLEMARLVWAEREGLARTVRIAWWPGHSQGRYAGSAWYADRFHDELARWGVAYLNLDGPGSRYVDHFALAHTAELKDFNVSTLREFIGMPASELQEEEMMGIPGRPGRNADQSFLGIGLASWAAYGEMPANHPERGKYAAASGGAWYWHTPDDTLDKVDLDQLVRETVLFTTQVHIMATAKVLPFGMKHMAEDFLLALHRYREAAGDHLDFERARTQARRFRENCGNLEVHKRAVEAKGDVWKAASLNETLLRTTRILNPVLYTVGGPHRPDPALPSTLLPGLRQAFHLKGLGEGAVQGTVVALQRELNRTEEALSQASEVLEAHMREEMEED